MKYHTNALRLLFAIISLVTLTQVGCGDDALPFSSTPVPANVLVYDPPVSFNIKSGSLLPGTSIAYGGKTESGAAKVLITGLVAPKQVGDSVDWQGAPAQNVNLKLATRVLMFDNQSVTLAGTSHIEVKDIQIKPGGSPGNVLIEFTVPVITFSLAKGQFIPGTKVAYLDSSNAGAQFAGVEGYPYRKQFDSLQYRGHVAPKVFLQLDLRVASYSDSGAVLAGTANIKIES